MIIYTILYILYYIIIKLCYQIVVYIILISTYSNNSKPYYYNNSIPNVKTEMYVYNSHKKKNQHPHLFIILIIDSLFR